VPHGSYARQFIILDQRLNLQINLSCRVMLHNKLPLISKDYRRLTATPCDMDATWPSWPHETGAYFAAFAPLNCMPALRQFSE
jgi:hypothetical protein